MSTPRITRIDGKLYWQYRYNEPGADQRRTISLGRDYEDSDGAPGSIAEHQAQILAAAADGALLLGTDPRGAIEQAKLTLPAAELADSEFPTMMHDGLPPLTVEVAPGHSKRDESATVIVHNVYVEHYPNSDELSCYICHFAAQPSTRRVHMQQTEEKTDSIYDERWLALPQFDVPRSDSPGKLVTFVCPGRACKGWDPVSPRDAAAWAADSLGVQLAEGWQIHGAQPPA